MKRNHQHRYKLIDGKDKDGELQTTLTFDCGCVGSVVINKDTIKENKNKQFGDYHCTLPLEISSMINKADKNYGTKK